MKFDYTGVTKAGEKVSGEIYMSTREEAARSLQLEGITISSLQATKTLGDIKFDWFSTVKNKDIVLLSRQIATLFTANVSAVRVFAMLAAEVENSELASILTEIVTDMEAGMPLSKAMAKHPVVFSQFYVNMVASGEETGKLSQTFEYLADYLERNYELTSKAKNALIYPSFVIATFIGVMILMLTYIIPRIGTILTESGQELPVYTKLVLGASSFLVNYGLIFAALLVIAVSALIFWYRTEKGKNIVMDFALHFPYVGELYRKLYLSRIADNMHTMLASGISMVKSLETTKSVIGNSTYESIIETAVEDVRTGKSLSQALQTYPEYIPPILTQMVAVGEESGNVGEMLKTLSEFYTREVRNAVDTLVGLFEPAMIVFLGLGVGTLLASVLIPIYNVSTGI